MIPCETCASGNLVQRRRYRSSVVVVLIGYLLLVPSLLGVAFGTLGVIERESTAESSASSARNETLHVLQAAEIPSRVIHSVLSLEDCDAGDLAALSDEQRETVGAARRYWSARKRGTPVSCSGDPWLLMAVMSLTGGILGSCCLLKKTVLQCMTCAAVQEHHA
jgi:hypothetical protein